MTTRAVVLLGSLILVGCAATEAPPSPISQGSSSAALSSQAVQEPTIITDNLQVPWGIAFLPDGDILVTERPGTVLRIGADQQRHSIAGVLHRGEGGLLGIALHPDFASNHWIYVYLTTASAGGTTNRVERYRYENDQLTDRTEILSNIPGAIYHDGGALAFGPDGMLYVTAGDATNEPLAQDTQSLAGKILRLRDDGSIPSDNPFGNAVYSYGHRNPQGLAWDDQGRLWATEHGRSGVRTGYDELNLIERGKNYGWPTIQGSETSTFRGVRYLGSGFGDVSQRQYLLWRPPRGSAL
jgi:glucose/arabinose dehydrogenase